jgi:small-conductance mechanosensitive channel
VLRRWGIRLGTSLVAIAAGLMISSAALGDFNINAGGLLEATLLFWIVHIIVSFLALRVLIRQPSVAMAGLLALASTVVALIIVALIVPGLNVHGLGTFVVATLIIWVATVIGDFVARSMIRDRREARRAA